MEKIKAVVRDKLGAFVLGECSNVEMKQDQKHFLEDSDYQTSHAKIQLQGFLEFFFKIFSIVFIETLIEEIEPLIRREYEFECQVEAKLIALFGNFCTIKIQSRGWREMLYQSKLFLKFLGTRLES